MRTSDGGDPSAGATGESLNPCGENVQSSDAMVATARPWRRPAADGATAVGRGEASWLLQELFRPRLRVRQSSQRVGRSARLHERQAQQQRRTEMRRAVPAVAVGVSGCGQPGAPCQEGGG